MYIQQLYTNCLAQAAYYIESNGEAAIIDPLRDPHPYVELAKMRKASIKYIFETHFHADFVSGHLDLSRLTGAPVVYGPDAKPAYPALVAYDHEKFQLGELTIEVLHTPGHTVESSCFLLYDKGNAPHSIFTGDTLFIGDVGRPDLLSGNLSKEELAGQLYDSLNNKIKSLPDGVIVYPGHGAGSACGKNIGKESSSTIGLQKKFNYALANLSKEDFIKVVTADLPVPPAYFFKDAAINVKGYGNYDDSFAKAHKKLNLAAFEEQVRAGAWVLDTRDPEHFGEGFIPLSVNIGLNGDFAVWVGTLVPFDTRLVLVSAKGKEAEAVRRLMRVGYENITGYLEGGIDNWKNSRMPLQEIKTLTAQETESLIESDQYILLDVRRPGEAQRQRLKQSVLIPLNELPNKVKGLDPDSKYLVYCAGGYRSMIASSILMKAGIKCVYNVDGGINRIKTEKPGLLESVE